ncbi:hypothetical protein SCT_0761 [Sulfuricella sp. T08]|uniref:hypothetical protein n=1 Tax=Sulfuricella sp. T08 TaxID=1632857 RepID=UPI000617A1BA|nr:hypothetical protein [Sulfuricella sp. T08]GAO35375.1 hypothetical protein SCT_0761 [Sulfuricella sp. T08]
MQFGEKHLAAGRGTQLDNHGIPAKESNDMKCVRESLLETGLQPEKIEFGTGTNHGFGAGVNDWLGAEACIDPLLYPTVQELNEKIIKSRRFRPCQTPNTH